MPYVEHPQVTSEEMELHLTPDGRLVPVLIVKTNMPLSPDLDDFNQADFDLFTAALVLGKNILAAESVIVRGPKATA